MAVPCGDLPGGGDQALPELRRLNESHRPRADGGVAGPSGEPSAHRRVPLPARGDAFGLTRPVAGNNLPEGTVGGCRRIQSVSGSPPSGDGTRVGGATGSRRASPSAVANPGLLGPSAENDRAIAVDQHAALGVPLHGAGEDLGLDITADGDQFVRVTGMVHADDVLFDDRPLVEVGVT